MASLSYNHHLHYGSNYLILVSSECNNYCVATPLTALHFILLKKLLSCLVNTSDLCVCVAESPGVSGAVYASVLRSCRHHVTTAAERRPAGAEGASCPRGLQPTGGHKIPCTGVRLKSQNTEQLISILSWIFLFL
jgi:hypothetical protein